MDDVISVIREEGPAVAMPRLGYSDNYGWMLISGRRKLTVPVIAAAVRAYPGRVDVRASLRLVDPEWTPEQIQAQYGVVMALAAVPAA